MLFGPKFSTIVFSDTSIKIAVAKSVKNRFKVSFLDKKSLPAQTVFNGRIINREVFEEELKTIFLENFDKIKTKNVVVGLNEPETFLTKVEFEKKPRHVESEIYEKIAPILPFDLSEASLLYKEVGHLKYQVAVAKTEELKLISAIFENVGFSIKAIVPIPLIFQQLLGKREFPYLFLSSEEDIVFSLVQDGATAFSSSFRLKKALPESEEEINSLTTSLIESEYKGKGELKNIYVHGSGTEFIKSFLKEKGFNTEIIFASDKNLSQSGHNAAEFGRAITLSLYEPSVLAFPKQKVAKNIQVQVQVKKEKIIKPIFLFVPLIIIAVFTIILFWPKLKDIVTQELPSQKAPASSEPATISAEPKEKTSPSTDKKEATVTPEPEKTINKKDYRIQVLNGTGKAGSAGEARDFLVSKGYVVENIGNAATFDNKKTTVRIKNSKKEVSDLLTKDLKERYSIDIGSPLAEDESYDIIIILGGE